MWFITSHFITRKNVLCCNLVTIHSLFTSKNGLVEYENWFICVCVWRKEKMKHTSTSFTKKVNLGAVFPLATQVKFRYSPTRYGPFLKPLIYGISLSIDSANDD